MAGRPNELGESKNTAFRIPALDYATLIEEVGKRNAQIQRKTPGAKLLTIADLLRPIISKECKKLRKKGN